VELPVLGGKALRSLCLVLASVVLLSACAAPMRMREIEAVSANCGNVSHQIKVLEDEKAKNNNRLLAGIQSVAPALAAFNIVRGTYGRNIMIATGEWAKTIDIKLAQLQRKRAACGKRKRSA
jgi:LEA14-like dessication related protein